MRARPFLIFGILGSLTACGTEAPAPESAEEGAVGWTVDAEPLTVVGEVEGAEEYMFGRVFGVELTDEGFVVADWEPRSLRVYDLEGRFVRWIGGEGEGPGEFQGIHGMTVTDPGAVHLLDMRSMRRSTFRLDGSLLESVSLQYEEGHPDHMVGRFPDGAVVVGWWNYGPDEGDGYRDIVTYAAFEADGRYAGRIADLPGQRRDSQGGSPNASSRPMPLSPFPMPLVVGDSLYFTDGASSVVVRSRSGDSIRAFALPPSPYTLDDAYPAIARARDADGRETDFSEVPSETSVPSVSTLLLDDQGLLWARRFDPGVHSAWIGDARSAPGGTWWVMDLDGEVLATVEAPADLIVRGIRGDRMIGTYRNELDVEQVAVHRIRGRQ